MYSCTNGELAQPFVWADRSVVQTSILDNRRRRRRRRRPLYILPLSRVLRGQADEHLGDRRLSPGRVRVAADDSSVILLTLFLHRD